MGCGDWNDGMNQVGALGQGESVWMAWFLIVVLRRMAPLAEARNEPARADSLRAQADALLEAAEKHAWDGDWYCRAFFDDGTPLGSARNDECRIDSLAQSWSVIAGADPDRTRRAMQAVDEQLVRAADRLILLFTPPFDKTPLNPGYIKGYLPGVRENGGQYTHAALWVVLAQALLGRGTRAMELFDMLNPVKLSSAPNRAEVYRGEAYAVAADVYSESPHVGRGGWTWYTGSAAWTYRVAVESILGFELRGDRLRIAPCIPADWPEYKIAFQRRGTKWEIVVKNPDGLERGRVVIRVDGQPLDGDDIPLTEDQGVHHIELELMAEEQVGPLPSGNAWSGNEHNDRAAAIQLSEPPGLSRRDPL
jgi:cyclic beta-1,2-glucan synthetase